MSTLANQIEAYLKQLLSEHRGVVELKRGDLAQIFMCVPSQINYVLETRFSAQQGYMVESRRGGGGYIRLVRLDLENSDMLQGLLKQKELKVSLQNGQLLLKRLLEEDILTEREYTLIGALLDKDLLAAAYDDADSLRGAMLNKLLLHLLREDFKV